MTGTDLTTFMTAGDVQTEFAMALGFTGDEGDAKGMAEASTYIYSVLSVVKNADPKTKLQACTFDSIKDAALDAAKMRVAIDGRKHAALIAYGTKATLQVTAAGYEAKLHENLDRADVKVDMVFEDDEFKVWSENEVDHYKHVKADPFADDPNKATGIYVAISYFKNNIRYQRVNLMPMSEVRKIMGAAKQDFIWKQWFIERAKTAAIKRACKRFFNNVQGLQAIVDYDNETHYKIDTERRSENNLIDNMNKKIRADEPKQIEADPLAGTPDGVVEAEVVEPEPVKAKPEKKPEADKPIENIAEVVDVEDETDEGIF